METPQVRTKSSLYIHHQHDTPCAKLIAMLSLMNMSGQAAGVLDLHVGNLAFDNTMLAHST